MKTVSFSSRLFLWAFLLSLLSIAPAGAQTIRNGSNWFDGSYYYTASVNGNSIRFESFNFRGDGPYFTMRKVADRSGEYILSINNDPEALALLRTEVGATVRHVRESGMNFLAVYNRQDELVWTLTLTPDSMEECFSQQSFAREQPVDETLDSFLMNTDFLGRFDKESIRLMISELAAISGKTPGTIARYNLELMRAELEVAESRRVGNEVKEYTVSTIDEFFQALGNYHTIRLEDDTHLNLTRFLSDIDKCTDAGILWVGDGADLSEREGVFSEERFDGRQLTLKGLRNLTIIGGENCSIVAEPRYANVFDFRDCEHVVLENLTLGHTEEGECEGGVLWFQNCSECEIQSCELFGCGTYGLQLRGCFSTYMASSVIRDCSYGIMEIYSSTATRFDNCDFFRCREFDLITVSESDDTSINDCRIFSNAGLLFAGGSPVEMEDCQIYHTMGDIGNVSVVSDKNTVWNNPVISVSPRAVGPDGGKNVLWRR